MAVIQDISFRAHPQPRVWNGPHLGQGAIWIYNCALKRIETPKTSWVTVYFYEEGDDLSKYAMERSKAMNSNPKLIYIINDDNSIGIFTPFRWDDVLPLDGVGCQKMIIDTVHNAVVQVFASLGWSTQELIDAHQAVVEAGYIYDRWFRKPKSNKNRSKRAGVWVRMENDLCIISVRQIDYDDNIVRNVEAVTLLPDPHPLGVLVNAFKWLDNDTIMLESKKRRVSRDYFETYEIQSCPAAPMELIPDPQSLTGYGQLTITVKV